MVICSLPVVISLLAHLLSGNNLGSVNTQRVDLLLLLRRTQLKPACSVAACEALHLLLVISDSQTVACEALLRHVTAPSDGVSVHDGVVDNAHHVVHRNVPAQRPAPVVLHLHSKLCPERMVCVAGDRHIVVELQTEALSKSLRCVGLALIFEALGTLAQIRVEYALKAHLPCRSESLGIALGHSLHIRSEHVEELVEVGKRVAVESAGQRHGVLGADTVVLEAVEYIEMASALSERHVTVHAHRHHGTVHICLVSHEHLAEVIGLAGVLQDLTLKVREA